MTKRQDPNLGFNPAASAQPGLQTSLIETSPLIFAQNFARGGLTAIGGNRPNAQQWEGPAPEGLADWRTWDLAGLIVQSWIDANRQAAMLELTGGNIDAPDFAFAGLFLDAPGSPYDIGPDSGGFSFTLYSRVRQICNDVSLNDASVLPNFFGPFVSFADLQDNEDGKFVAGGVSYLGAQGFAAMSCNFNTASSLADDPVVLLGPYLNYRIRCELTNIESPLTTVEVSADRDGTGFVSLGLYLQNGFPTAVGLGGMTPNGDDPQGATFGANYLRAYNTTAVGARGQKLTADGGQQSIG
jgi:hypothetical protein